MRNDIVLGRCMRVLCSGDERSSAREALGIEKTFIH